MSKSTLLYSGSAGLNNKVDPKRISFNPQTGVIDLATAYNVDIDASGRISRRKGYTTTAVTSNIHSLFCDGGDCFYVSGTSLYKLNEDHTSALVVTGLAYGIRMWYVQVGYKTYYSNGYQLGYVEGGVNHTWEAGTYVGPTTYVQYSNPPLGTQLEVHSGRMYIVQGKTLWYSEPFWHGGFDLASNFVSFYSNIQMVKAVNDGLYVSDEYNTFFLRGHNPKEFTIKMVDKAAAILGTAVKVPGRDVGRIKYEYNQGKPGRVVMWTTRHGICIGMDSGEFNSLTEDRLEFPSALVGTAVYHQDKYICLLFE
jgi:hypothetical protein